MRPRSPARDRWCSGTVPRHHSAIVRGQIGSIWAQVVLDVLPCLGELLVRSMETFTRATDALETLVFLHLLTCPGEPVARVVEHLTRLTYTLQRRVELVRRLGHDVVVLTRPS
jgi:hypothetical protein